MTNSDGKFGSLLTSEATYANIVESRIAIVFPKIKKLLTQQRAQAILDYGGGDGLFLQKSMPKNIVRAVHYDASANMRKLAQERLIANDKFSVVAKTKRIPPGTMDAVTMIAVWMEFPNRRTAMSNLREIARLLRPDGRLYAAVTHPCFHEEKFSTFWTDFSNTNYLRSGPSYTVTVSDGKGNASFLDYHWNLEQMTSQLCDSGFTIRRIFETSDTTVGQSTLRGSPWLIFEAQKIG